MTDFSVWFVSITGKSPFPYQERLATSPDLPICLDVPTGVGKTAAAVLSWLWRRRYTDEAIRVNTPRRLVYCLPMRSLVEQTYAVVEEWLENAKLTGQVELHMLMGGVVSRDWDAHPEKDGILVGTQDQLLSHALNRGYAMSRYRWPIHYALLNNDCLWVMDETQLMGAGLQTTAQLQGFRKLFGTYGPTHSLWMSATLDSKLLQTVDYQPNLENVEQLTNEDFNHSIIQQRIQAHKHLLQAQTAFEGDRDVYSEALATEVHIAHTPGTLTVVICNRVSRAQKVYKALQKIANHELLPLIHSRFRTAERESRKDLFGSLSRGERFGILVATPAIEAGIDVSAKVLFTELAPTSSLIQRFGRCNRYGEWSASSDAAPLKPLQEGNAVVYWIDIDLSKKDANYAASPYTVEELETARKLLKQLSDVGLESLKRVEAPAQDKEGLLPRRQDVLQLFDTTPDLAGHDIDVSSFIRESSESDLAIAWRKWDGYEPPPDLGDLHQKELCRVNVRSAQKFARDAWVWDGLRRAWVQPNKLYAGQNLLLKCKAGGYSEELGWTGDPKDKPDPILVPIISKEADASDNLTNIGQFVTLREHSEDVAKEARQLCQSFQYPDLPDRLIERAARWHDLGKAHDAFQEMMTPKDFEADAIGPYRKAGGPWAKSDHSSRMRNDRCGFRHELVSALVALQQGESFLLCYLVAAHHGKVRMTIQPRPTEKAPGNKKRYALGVWEGDICPAVDLGGGVSVEEQELSLACMELGTREQRESWTSGAIALLDEYGPMRLAFLETIIRLADWRGSAKRTTYLLEPTDA